MYRVIPLKMLRQKNGSAFDEMIHIANNYLNKPIEYTLPISKPPWYVVPNDDDKLLVLQGTNYVDIYCPEKKENASLVLEGTRYIHIYCPERKEKASFTITPNKIYKNDELYYDVPVILIWPTSIFYRIVNGDQGGVSINFSTHSKKFNLDDSFDIYHLNRNWCQNHIVTEQGVSRPVISYKYPDYEVKTNY